LKTLDLNKVIIEVLASNILFITLKDGVFIEVEDVLEIKKINLDLTKGKEYALVFETGNYTSVSKEAREIMTAKSVEKGRLATAFIINSLSQRMLGNFYIQMNKPKVPAKLFTKKEEALKWVKKYL